MSHKGDDGNFYIAAEPSGRCEMCGAVEETRPYGPDGEQVCFACGMKDEKAMERQFLMRLQAPAEEL